MKKQILVILLLCCMIFGLLAGCKEETIDAAKAKQIVLEELGMSEAEANPHVHAGEHDGKPCYSVYVTIGGVTMEYQVDMETGEILAVNKSSHSH